MRHFILLFISFFFVEIAAQNKGDYWLNLSSKFAKEVNLTRASGDTFVLDFNYQSIDLQLGYHLSSMAAIGLKAHHHQGGIYSLPEDEYKRDRRQEQWTAQGYFRAYLVRKKSILLWLDLGGEIGVHRDVYLERDNPSNLPLQSERFSLVGAPALGICLDEQTRVFVRIENHWLLINRINGVNDLEPSYFRARMELGMMQFITAKGNEWKPIFPKIFDTSRHFVDVKGRWNTYKHPLYNGNVNLDIAFGKQHTNLWTTAFSIRFHTDNTFLSKEEGLHLGVQLQKHFSFQKLEQSYTVWKNKVALRTTNSRLFEMEISGVELEDSPFFDRDIFNFDERQRSIFIEESIGLEQWLQNRLRLQISTSIALKGQFYNPSNRNVQLEWASQGEMEYFVAPNFSVQTSFRIPIYQQYLKDNFLLEDLNNPHDFVGTQSEVRTRFWF